MTEPKRIQRKRTKGWKMPKGTVYVGRPTKWGNPHVLTPWFREAVEAGAMSDEGRRRLAVQDFRDDLDAMNADVRAGFLAALRGKDLACWCPLNQPCHADVLLELANAALSSPVETAPEKGKP
jgi:hypothetical protein